MAYANCAATTAHDEAYIRETPALAGRSEKLTDTAGGFIALQAGQHRQQRAGKRTISRIHPKALLAFSSFFILSAMSYQSSTISSKLLL